MVEILSSTGELYKYDQETDRLYKDGFLLSSTTAEPVFSDVNGNTKFSGIYLKNTNQILTLSGNLNPVTNSNAIQ